MVYKKYTLLWKIFSEKAKNEKNSISKNFFLTMFNILCYLLKFTFYYSKNVRIHVTLINWEIANPWNINPPFTGQHARQHVGQHRLRQQVTLCMAKFVTCSRFVVNGQVATSCYKLHLVYNSIVRGSLLRHLK